MKSSSFANQSIPCSFGEVKGKRLSVSAQSAVPVSTTLTVEHEDALFLGEVVTCRPSGQGFELEIKVEQVLSGLQSLMALRSQLLSDGPATRPSVSPFFQAFACR